VAMQEVRIDGRPYAVDPGGVGQPLRARVGADEVVLPVWTWGDHRRALRRHLRVEVDRLVLDETGYAHELLQLGSVDPAHWDELVPLALWWSAGAAWAADPSEPQVRDGWVSLGGGVRARVRGWSWRERLTALRECVTEEGSHWSVDPLAIVERLVDMGVVELEGPGKLVAAGLDALEVGLVHRLLVALTRLSLPRPVAEREPLLADPRLAGAILALCRALRWTPSQVLEAPASEIDELRALLGHEPAQPRAAAVVERPVRRGGLHAHPDAVVLVFGEEARP